MNQLRLLIAAILAALALASCDTVSPSQGATTAVPAAPGGNETSEPAAVPADSSAYPLAPTISPYPAP